MSLRAKVQVSADPDRSTPRARKKAVSPAKDNDNRATEPSEKTLFAGNHGPAGTEALSTVTTPLEKVFVTITAPVLVGAVMRRSVEWVGTLASVPRRTQNSFFKLSGCKSELLGNPS